MSGVVERSVWKDPDEWVKLRWIFRIVNGGTPSTTQAEYWNGDVVWVTPEDLSKADGTRITDSARRLTVEGIRNSGAELVPEGTLVLSTRAPIGYAVMAGTGLSTNQGCRSLVPSDEIVPKFGLYALLSERAGLKAAGRGSTFKELSGSDLGNHRIPLPPLPTQRAIASFLDRETEKIDTLIEKKQRLLELLEEKRTALITRAVIRGLDPDMPMKDSGVEWLGEIPEHWKVVNAKAVFELHRGFDLPEDQRTPGDVPVVSSGGFVGTHGEARVLAPGVVTGRTGSLGTVYFVDEDYWPLNTALYVRRFRGNDPKYLYWLIGLLPVLKYAAKSAVPGVDRKDVHAERVPLPPLPEQKTIAEGLKGETGRHESIVESVSQAISLLQEYRTALISAAVTGKIDVRDKVPA